MAARDGPASWGSVTRTLHWTMAGLILFQLGFGLAMTREADLALRFALTQTHKSWGTVVFVLALLRIGWRLGNRRHPRLPAGTPAWQRRVAGLSHALLYLGMLVMPVSGWVMASAAPLQDLLGMQNLVFGRWPLPDPWVPGNAAIEAAAHRVHVVAAAGLAAVILVHVGAALWHRFWLRDRVLTAMVVGK